MPDGIRRLNKRIEMKVWQMIKSVASRAVDCIKSAGAKVALVGGGLALIGSRAHAQSADFDYTTFSGTLTTGLTAVGVVATGIAGIMAGVLVWRKIARYFNKGG